MNNLDECQEVLYISEDIEDQLRNKIRQERRERDETLRRYKNAGIAGAAIAFIFGLLI